MGHCRRKNWSRWRWPPARARGSEAYFSKETHLDPLVGCGSALNLAFASDRTDFLFASRILREQRGPNQRTQRKQRACAVGVGISNRITHGIVSGIEERYAFVRVGS